METRTDEETTVEESTYSIISYPAAQLPKTYHSMVFSKWLRSLRHGNEYFKLIDSNAYFAVYQKYIEVLLSRPNTIIKIAVLTNEPDTALGFSVVEGFTLHYVHVHKDNRKAGIAMSLIPKNIEYTTHLTKDGMSLWASKFPKVIFNPFI